MIEPSAQLSAPQEISIQALARATRFALAMIAIVLAYLPFRFSMLISNFEKISEDMLGAASQIPVITRYLFASAPFIVALSGAIMLAPVAVLFMRNIPRSLYILGALAVVSVVNSVVISHALFAPLLEIITRMQGGTPGM
jgi:hypothetical protein